MQLFLIVLVLTSVCDNNFLESNSRADALCLERSMDDEDLVNDDWSGGVDLTRTKRSSEKSDDSSQGSDTEYRVIGGYPVDIVQLPSIVHISISPAAGWRLSCSGHLLTSMHVMTVASCLCKYNDFGNEFSIIPLNMFRLRVGSTNYHQGGHESRVKKICVHPKHMKHRRAFYYKDIGILTLEKKVKLGKSSDVVVIHPEIQYVSGQLPFNASDCFIAGWGPTSADDDSLSYDLVIAQVKMISLTSCRFRYSKRISRQSNLCTLGNKFTCRGDSGGGLFCNSMMVGLISWRWTCSLDYPQVYVRVDNVKEFISWASKSSTCQPLISVLQLDLIIIMLVRNFAHLPRHIL